MLLLRVCTGDLLCSICQPNCITAILNFPVTVSSAQASMAIGANDAINTMTNNPNAANTGTPTITTGEGSTASYKFTYNSVWMNGAYSPPQKEAMTNCGARPSNGDSSDRIFRR